MESKRKIIISVITIIFLLSALVYNLLYINNKKNEIIEEINYEEFEDEIIEKEEKLIYVHIAGAVDTPGLYGLSEGSRVNDLIIAAGGLLENADLTDINLAYVLADATKVTIPTKGEEETKTTTISNQISSKENTSKVTGSGLVNINTATVSQLKTLNGIGDATANKIIEYRNVNGSFKSVDELKNVSGIGEAKFAKIMEYVTI